MKYRLIGGVLLAAVLSVGLPAQRGSPSSALREGPAQSFDPRFELVPTQNIWTFLLLDSSNGRVWQVHYAVTDSAFAGRLPLNELELAPPASAHPGRFVLRETQNIFTFLLLDQDDGRVWQVQWSNDEKSRGIVRVLADGSS
ncbi:MAG: hypothetical protein KGL93_07305 [Gemmatimonadota bacterium]|nr:hypothetical protein [Gemmatimonadota bacterium]